MSVREQFETWARKEGINLTKKAPNAPGYAFPRAVAAWHAWQEARKQTLWNAGRTFEEYFSYRQGCAKCGVEPLPFAEYIGQFKDGD